MKEKVSIIVYGRMPTEKAYGIHALNQAKSFNNLGYEVELIYPSTKNKYTINQTIEEYYDEIFDFKVIEKENFDITGIKIFNFFPNFLKKFLWLFSSYVWAKSLKNIVADSIIWSTNPVICWVLKDSRKIIFEKHGEGKRAQKLFINKLKSNNFFLIGTTKTSFEELKNVNSQSIYLTNGVDINRFYPSKNHSSEIIVGYAGMLETYGFDKGMLSTVTEMLKVMDDTNFKVVIIGGPEYKINEIKNIVNQSTHIDNFKFISRLPQNQLAEKIRQFDIGLVPYPKNTHMNLYASPLKIFEYMASGVIPLVSDLTAHKEINLDGIVYYEQDSIESFENALKGLLNKETIINKKKEVLNQITKISLDYRSEKIIEFLRL